MGLGMGYKFADERTSRAPDWLDRSGAQALKSQIEAYWRERGYPHVQVVVQEAPFTSATRSIRFDLRSNIRNGYPDKTVDIFADKRMFSA